jgi:hypothetical protein
VISGKNRTFGRLLVYLDYTRLQTTHPLGEKSMFFSSANESDAWKKKTISQKKSSDSTGL